MKTIFFCSRLNMFDVQALWAVKWIAGEINKPETDVMKKNTSAMIEM